MIHSKGNNKYLQHLHSQLNDWVFGLLQIRDLIKTVYNKEKTGILTLEKLRLEDYWHFLKWYKYF